MVRGGKDVAQGVGVCEVVKVILSNITLSNTTDVSHFRRHLIGEGSGVLGEELDSGFHDVLSSLVIDNSSLANLLHEESKEIGHVHNISVLNGKLNSLDNINFVRVLSVGFRRHFVLSEVVLSDLSVVFHEYEKVAHVKTLIKILLN